MLEKHRTPIPTKLNPETWNQQQGTSNKEPATRYIDNLLVKV